LSIQLLSPQLANQIAAGEVVERPASVVKELLENSLDAGADKIEIDIEKGGHKRIRLKDNGGGIAKDELQLALSRHATSKISTLDDLERILSLGFRGEALASISSVSRLTLTSKTESQNEAWQAYCEGREMAVNIQPAAHPKGTTIDVADLFYNTPARRKFLRAEKTEFQHIEDVVKRIALSYPHASFILKHNGKTTKRYIADKHGSLAPRIAAVVGQKFIDNAVHINVKYEGITMNAWLGSEVMLRSSNDCQFSFVNGRGMRDKLIMHAIRQAYESVWGVLEQPSFVVYLTLDPKDVDVNVHPAKHEVRFQQGRLVHDFICKTVCDALHSITSESETQHHGEAERFDEPVKFNPPQQSHDYIRPLSHSPASSSQSGLGASGGGSLSGLSGHRQSKAPTAAYQSNFNRLMTPNSDTLSSTEREQSQHIALNSYCRIYVRNENVYLLDVKSFANVYLQDVFETAEHSQPLLMPVALEVAHVEPEKIEVLNALNFEINQVAGKYRLQQVPAGTRHFPWIRWFERLLESDVADDDKRYELVLSDDQDLDEILCAQLWHWLDEKNDVKQWECIERFGKVRSLEGLISTWGNNHG
jgi:DNA mismatch repair protein MutL